MQDQTEMNALLAHRFAAFRVGRWKLPATAAQEKWQPRLNANRTRLIATRFFYIYSQMPFNAQTFYSRFREQMLSSTMAESSALAYNARLSHLEPLAEARFRKESVEQWLDNVRKTRPQNSARELVRLANLSYSPEARECEQSFTAENLAKRLSDNGILLLPQILAHLDWILENHVFCYFEK